MPHTHSRKEKGQSLVELSFVFTLLLLLVGGIIDLGSMFYTSVALRDTVQEGAIFAASHPIEPSLISDRITQSAGFPVDSSQITTIGVTCGGSACAADLLSCQGEEITIQIGYNYHLIMPIIPMVIGRQDVPLRASVTATILQSPAGNTTCPTN